MQCRRACKTSRAGSARSRSSTATELIISFSRSRRPVAGLKNVVVLVWYLPGLIEGFTNAHSCLGRVQDGTTRMLQVPDWKLRLRGEVLSYEAMLAILPAWEDLCGRVVEDNVYYSPRYACALISNIERNKSLRFATVWHDNMLVALLPFTRAAFETPLLGTAARAWQTRYTFSCMPLLDRACAVNAAATLVELLATINGGEWIFPVVNTQGAACLAVIDALGTQGRRWRFANAFERSTLVAELSFDEHMRTNLSSKRRRDLARNRRRLEALGTVTHESFRSGEKLTGAVEAFLAIEAAGWKGERSTALACRPDTRQFAFDAFTDDGANSICRADVLRLNGTEIAISLAVFAGRTGFTVKCTYDETYRSYSPGLLLEIEVLRSFLTEHWADRLDAATNGTHVIDDLWPGRMRVADLMFTLASRHPVSRLSALAHIDQAKKAMKRAAKNVWVSLGEGMTH